MPKHLLTHLSSNAHRPASYGADAAQQRKRRSAAGRKGSMVGILANSLLALTKITIGLLSGALSILGDGFNNLFDALASLVSLASFHLAEKPEDREHPFGHARAEYMGSFFIAIAILYVAVTLIIEGVKRIVTPQTVTLNGLQLLLLLLSIGVKLAMVVYFTRMSRQWHSNVFAATAADAKSDILATGAILLALVLSPFVGFSLDGPFTVAVAVLIGQNGFTILKDNYDALLGKAPDQKLVQSLAHRLRSFQGVLGIHDMIVHDYGPGNCFVTVHVEVDGKKSAMESHALVDHIERTIGDEYGVQITIHMDPQQPRTAEVVAALEQVTLLVRSKDARFLVHDFRLITNAKERRILFDVLIPWDKQIDAVALREELEEEVKKLYPGDTVNITIDPDRTMRLMEEEKTSQERIRHD